MKKLSLTLLLMVLSFFTIEANVMSVNGSSQRSTNIYLKKWDRAERSMIPNPIECRLTDDCIEVYFIEHPIAPVTLQIKDTFGNVLYQDMTVSGQQDIFRIIVDLQPGSYEFYYLDKKMILKGEFKIE